MYVFIITGVGVVKLLSCTILCLYYPILMVNTIFYSIWSLYQPLPTSQCITKLLPRFTTQVCAYVFRIKILIRFIIFSKNSRYSFFPIFTDGFDRLSKIMLEVSVDFLILLFYRFAVV